MFPSTYFAPVYFAPRFWQRPVPPVPPVAVVWAGQQIGSKLRPRVGMNIGGRRAT